MKKILFIILFVFSASVLFAQKAERKAIRSGNDAYKEQRYGAAQSDYMKALEVNAGSKEASYNLANSYYKQGQWDEALKEYQHYLTLENEDNEKMSAAWSNMGNTFLKKKANEKSSAQKQMPQGGQQQQQEDNLKMSMEAYKNALRLNPQDNDTRYNLAVVQKMIKDKEDKGGGGGQDQNKDQDKDQNKEKQDQNKDNKQDQNKDQKKDQDQNKKQDQQNQNQMSQDNIQQILQAIEQDEKQTQERVKQGKAEERKKQNENNRRQNKDW